MRPYHATCQASILLHMFLHHQAKRTRPRHVYYHVPILLHTRLIIYPEYIFSTTTFLPFIIFTIVFISISKLHVATTTLLLTFIEILVVSISFLFVVKSPNLYIYDVYDDGYCIVCREKHRSVSRSVSLYQVDKDKIQYLWEVQFRRRIKLLLLLLSSLRGF